MLIAAILVAGCAKSDVGVVTGSITVDGLPAKSGSIGFYPVNRKSSTAGGEIVDGQYTANVPLGTFKVEIRVPKVVGQKKLYDTPDSPVKQLLAESLPPKFNDKTELTLEVLPAENRKDYQLTTKSAHWVLRPRQFKCRKLCDWIRFTRCGAGSLRGRPTHRRSCRSRRSGQGAGRTMLCGLS